MIDRYYKLQAKDVFTELQIYFIGESSGSIPFKIKYEGEFGERVSAHQNNVFHMLAEDGVFDLTPFKMYGPPGGTYQVTLALKYFGNGGFDYHYYTIRTKGCVLGESVSNLGECTYCEDPYFYSIKEPSKIQIDPIPCLRCDSNQNAFECGGGSNLITKEGFF